MASSFFHLPHPGIETAYRKGYFDAAAELAEQFRGTPAWPDFELWLAEVKKWQSSFAEAFILPGCAPEPIPGRSAVYELIDPRTKEVRYVGQSFQPSARLRQHCDCNKLDPKKKVAWVQELAASGLVPEMRIVGWFEARRANDAEYSQISRAVAAGHRLFNLDFGTRRLCRPNRKPPVVYCEKTGAEPPPKFPTAAVRDAKKAARGSAVPA